MRPEEYEGEMIDPRCDKCGKSGSHICAPTARELLDDIENVPSAYELASRVEKVLALHSRTGDYCKHCTQAGVMWPCPTVRALNGEEP